MVNSASLSKIWMGYIWEFRCTPRRN